MRFRRSFLIIALTLVAQGCVGLALQTSPSLIPNMTQAVFEECDVALARASMPADLKLMEGLLKSAPQNTQILTALSMGFTGYGLLFLEDDDPERASSFYAEGKGIWHGSPGRRGEAIAGSHVESRSGKDPLAGLGSR